MRQFEYVSPMTREQAVGLLGRSWEEAAVLAGGTDLLSLMKDDVVTPKRLVSLKRIGSLAGMSSSPEAGLRIGALVTLQELLDLGELAGAYPALVTAAAGVTSPQVRAMGTVVGDLCQRPRCWYFRSGFGLLGRDENGRSLIPEGDNRYHAILGNSGPAFFVNPSSLAPPLIALEAVVAIFGPDGEREIPLERFFRTPREANDREHDLRPDEIVTGLRVPPAKGARSATYEVRQREALDWPLATASVALKMSGDTVAGARVVMGHVAPVPWRSSEAEGALAGKSVNEEVAAAAAAAAVGNAKALSGNGYKIRLAQVAVKRAVLAAGGASRGASGGR